MIFSLSHVLNATLFCLGVLLLYCCYCTVHCLLYPPPVVLTMYSVRRRNTCNTFPFSTLETRLRNDARNDKNDNPANPEVLYKTRTYDLN